ncbi:MAG: hypothetical protein WCC87_22175 [Candidatus Korobacteraceae bacterium]
MDIIFSGDLYEGSASAEPQLKGIDLDPSPLIVVLWRLRREGVAAPRLADFLGTLPRVHAHGKTNDAAPRLSLPQFLIYNPTKKRRSWWTSATASKEFVGS